MTTVTISEQILMKEGDQTEPRAGTTVHKQLQ